MKKRFFFLAALFALPTLAGMVLEAQSASEKERHLFELVEKSAYGDNLPEIVGPSAWAATSLLDASYDSQVFSHPGDIMITGRQKLIHGYGTTALVSFSPSVHHPYTGLLSSGAPHGIIRISFARPPSANELIPGIGLKFFIDGKPSLNVLAMPSLDPQSEANIFAHPYTTDLKAPQWSFLKWLLENRFASALSYVGLGGGNPRSLSLTQLVSQTSMGERVSSPVDPFALVFVPTKELSNLCDSEAYQDFRVQLEGKGKGVPLFEVFAKGSPEGKLVSVGTITATSNFIASAFGDEKLYFRHPPVHVAEGLDEL